MTRTLTFPWLPVALLLTGFLAVILGWSIFRLKGHYLAIATLGLSQIVIQILVNWRAVTHGVMGVKNIPAPSLLGLELATEKQFYYLAFAFALVGLLFARNIIKYHIGQQLIALRGGEFGLETIGINTSKLKILAFALSAVYSGLGGALFAHLTGFTSPDFYGMNQMIVFLAMLIIGGRSSILGASLGAILITFLPEWLRFLKDYYVAVYALILIFLMIFMPSGLVGVIRLVLTNFIPRISNFRKKGASV